MADTLGGTTVPLPGGKYQNLDTGQLHDVHTDEVIEETNNTGKDVIQSDQIGAFRRDVHTDGSVATVRTGPSSSSAEIQLPVPLPGGQQDQAGTGQVTDVKSKATKLPKSNS